MFSNMNDVIHLLPDSVANQIAAGEVVQRPSSIVKELVENSIDAGSENIQILVVDGGKTSVQVIDDGKGMSETDARLSFERHATSKILKASDMFSLTTMGFRGEALASIAAVAQVELRTRRQMDELGTCVRISGSKIESQDPVACPVGCNFAVRNLFFNVPARRKFLKTNQTELSNVVSDFERIALVYPNIHFSLYNNGAEIYDLPKTTVRQRIADVFGRKISPELLPIEADTSLVSISGYIAKPECSRKKGSRQFFFVNGRYMRHPYFHSAVMKAYENLIPVGEQISYFIYLDVDASAIDVNVHPTKTEIKFDNEQSIWQVLSAVVREAIGKFVDVPSIEFDVADKPDIPVMNYGKYAPAPPRMNPNYNPFKPVGNTSDLISSCGVMGKCGVSNKEEDQLPQLGTLIGDEVLSGPADNVGFGTERFSADQIDIWSDNTDGGEKNIVDEGITFFQMKGRYIVFPVKSGLMLVDQHRAHVRILYERYKNNMAGRKCESQRVLFPEVVQLSKQETLAMDEIYSDLHSVGFELSNLGGGAYSILGVPADIEGLDFVRLLRNLVLSALEKNGCVREDAQNAVLLSLASSAAVVYGQVLQNKEMEALIGDLFSTSSPMITPDGKVVAVIMNQGEIDKRF